MGAREDIVLYKALDGLRFWWGDHLWALRSGLYGGGNGAIIIDGGEPLEAYTKLTANLASPQPSVDLPCGEFHVKRETDADQVARYLVREGLFHPLGISAGAGYVDAYAVVWRFAPCSRPEEHGGSMPAVLCAGCKARWHETYLTGEERHLARDTTKRLVRA